MNLNYIIYKLLERYLSLFINVVYRKEINDYANIIVKKLKKDSKTGLKYRYNLKKVVKNNYLDFLTNLECFSFSVSSIP